MKSAETGLTKLILSPPSEREEVVVLASRSLELKLGTGESASSAKAACRGRKSRRFSKEGFQRGVFEGGVGDSKWASACSEAAKVGANIHLSASFLALLE